MIYRSDPLPPLSQPPSLDKKTKSRTQPSISLIKYTHIQKHKPLYTTAINNGMETHIPRNPKQKIIHVTDLPSSYRVRGFEVENKYELT